MTPSDAVAAHLLIGTDIPYEESESEDRIEKRRYRRRVAIVLVLTFIVAWLALGVSGWKPYGGACWHEYMYFSPLDTLGAAYAHVHNIIAYATHWFEPYYPATLITPSITTAGTTDFPTYYLFQGRFGIVAITLVCGALLAVSGMLYQNVFKNPIAGPGMLGASSGVSVGFVVVILMFGAGATSTEALGVRYALTYGTGALTIAFVMLAGWWLSGRNKPFDIVTMMLIGAITGQLFGFVTSFITMFVMDTETYELYYELSQMLTVDTSLYSFLVLGGATLVSIVPIIFLRYRMNTLAFEEEEVRLLGLSFTGLRAAALVCGGFMILAAQAHIGALGLVTVVIPFVSRSLFGCEFTKQLGGSVALGMLFCITCRLIADCIPFVGQGVAIGSVASVAILPLFVYVMTTKARGWE